MIIKIQNFLNTEHTPLEKGLLILAGFLSGIIVGFLISPVKKGIQLWGDIASKNSNNTSTMPSSKSKQKKNPTK